MANKNDDTKTYIWCMVVLGIFALGFLFATAFLEIQNKNKDKQIQQLQEQIQQYETTQEATE